MDVKVCMDGIKGLILDVLKEAKNKGEQPSTLQISDKTNIRNQFSVSGERAYSLAIDFTKVLLLQLSSDGQVLFYKKDPCTFWELSSGSPTYGANNIDAKVYIDRLKDIVVDAFAENGSLCLAEIAEKTGITNQLKEVKPKECVTSFMCTLLSLLQDENRVQKNVQKIEGKEEIYWEISAQD